MGKVGRVIMWLALAAMALLAVSAVAGSFYGAEKARQFFNSVPLIVYWYALAGLFIAGFLVFSPLLRKPSSLLIHAGCLFVLLGAMQGSQAGHRIAMRLFGTEKIASGYMIIQKGQTESRIFAADLNRVLGQLSFGIKLNDFRLEYYEADKAEQGQLYIETKEGRRLQLAAEAGEEISLGEGKGKLKVVRTFSNFKIRIENGEKIVTDEKGVGENPAAEVEMLKADGKIARRYVFERFEAHSQNDDGLKLSYRSQGARMIRDYLSDVAVLRDGKEVIGKTIEVNHPLHYGGYNFYQNSYDAEAGRYTILAVVSDSGLHMVYSGFWLLGVGVFWRFWGRSRI